MSGEEVLYRHGEVTITTRLARFGAATYPIANIGSVAVEPAGAGGLETALIAGSLAFAGWVLFAHGWQIALAVAIGLPVLIVLASGARGQESLVLRTSSGDVRAVTAPSREIAGIKAALEAAFAERAG